jgi:NADPH-dependent 2,4-dienoyl-CoA reductase/sulfur reductase-like enzyme
VRHRKALSFRGSGGVSVATDLVLFATGVRPNAALAAAAGAELGAGGAIRVSRTMQTSVPGIWQLVAGFGGNLRG